MKLLKGGSKLSETGNNVKNFLTSGSVIAQIVLAIILILLIILIYKTIINFSSRWSNFKESKIVIKNGKTLCPKTSVVLPGEMFHRSKNELGGIEFSWSFWMYIEDWSYKYGQWKHILHKGNSCSWPNRAPGIWLHPRENTMRFYMNTYDSIAGNYIDIPSIPLRKWFHVVFSINQLTMDVHINGTLRKSLKFSGLPKQNFGDVYLMAFRGFDGYMSKVTYYTYAIPYSEIESNLNAGPGKIECMSDSQKRMEGPPYLTPNWWINSYQSGAPEYA
jgi:hypothetical protein